MTGKQLAFVVFGFVVAAIVGIGLVGCTRTPEAQSISGVKMAVVGKAETNSNGHTVEQQNIIERIKRDNEVGALKHLYIISPYSGQVILYSPVKGKVTTGGKRLTPRSIEGVASTNNASATKPAVTIGGVSYTTGEVANEDGSYGGGDAPYLFWFTPDGKYMQHYLSGGVIVHVSDQPLAVKGVIITVESDKK